MTSISELAAKASETLMDDVTAVNLGLCWRHCAKAVTVVPDAMTMESLGMTSWAAAVPILYFSSGKSFSFSFTERLAVNGLIRMALPWLRYKRPWRSKSVRSLRIVTAETCRLSLKADTRTDPCLSSWSRMADCLSSLVIIYIGLYKSKHFSLTIPPLFRWLTLFKWKTFQNSYFGYLFACLRKRNESHSRYQRHSETR